MRLNSPPVGRTVHIWRIDLTDVRWDDGEQQDAEPQHVARERRHRVALREASDRRFHSAQEILRVWSLANGIPGVVVA